MQVSFSTNLPPSTHFTATSFAALNLEPAFGLEGVLEAAIFVSSAASTPLVKSSKSVDLLRCLVKGGAESIASPEMFVALVDLDADCKQKFKVYSEWLFFGASGLNKVPKTQIPFDSAPNEPYKKEHKVNHNHNILAFLYLKTHIVCSCLKT
jgi:hypothetical protein